MLPNIHILGIQGSGKGTQSDLLVKKYGLSYVASGELFRTMSSRNDELGHTLKSELSAGHLISDELVLKIVDQYLQEASISIGFLGDGVIRTLPQVEGFAPMWERHNLDQPLLVVLNLAEDIARKRIENRIREHEEQGKEVRGDDHPEAITKRFALYHELTEPVITAFKESGRCIEISADASVEAIHTEICTQLESIYPDILHGTD